jgi:four helix bundle protein
MNKVSKPTDATELRGQSGNRAIGQKNRVGSSFREIAVWRESQSFAASVAELVDGLPQSRSSNVIGIQLLRSAGSIPANVAEGYGRYSQASYRNHLSIARGSAFESESWLDLLVRRGHVPAEEGARLIALCQTVQRMITTRMRGLGEANQSYAIREEGPAYDASI